MDSFGGGGGFGGGGYMQADLNACIFDDMRNRRGSSFHSLGAHTENALSSQVTNLDLGTLSRC